MGNTEYKNTEDLLEQLKMKNMSYEDWLGDNEDSFIQRDLAQFWHIAVEESGISKTDITNRANLGWTYLYDILKGKKIPSRDTIVRLFLAMQLGSEKCQEALKMNNWAVLYPKVKRDSVLLYALNHKLSMSETETLLKQQQETALKKTNE